MGQIRALDLSKGVSTGGRVRWLRRTQTPQDRFAALLTAHRPALLRFALRLEPDEASAEDLLQRTVERALPRFGQLEEEATFRAWLSRVLYRVWLNARPRRDRAWLEEAGWLENQRRTDGSPETGLRTRRLAGQLDEALRGLPEGQRAAVWLVDGQGFSFTEAAAILDVRPGTVASRVARGRSALRTELAEVAAAWGVSR